MDLGYVLLIRLGVCRKDESPFTVFTQFTTQLNGLLNDIVAFQLGFLSKNAKYGDQLIIKLNSTSLALQP